MKVGACAVAANSDVGRSKCGGGTYTSAAPVPLLCALDATDDWKVEAGTADDVTRTHDVCQEWNHASVEMEPTVCRR